VDVELLQSACEASRVAVPLEEHASHGTRDLIDAVTEEEASLVHRERGLGSGEELAVEKDG